MSEKSLSSELYSASAIMGMLPENPGYNGSVLLIDDEEATRISSVLTRAAEALSSPPHVADALDGERLIAIHDAWSNVWQWSGDMSDELINDLVALRTAVDADIAARAEAGGGS